MTVLNLHLNEDVIDLMDLVEKFLAYAEDLLERKMITKQQYDEITYNKIKFLNDIENDILHNKKTSL